MARQYSSHWRTVLIQKMRRNRFEPVLLRRLQQMELSRVAQFVRSFQLKSRSLYRGTRDHAQCGRITMSCSVKKDEFKEAERTTKGCRRFHQQEVSKEHETLPNNVPVSFHTKEVTRTRSMTCPRSIHCCARCCIAFSRFQPPFLQSHGIRQRTDLTINAIAHWKEK